MDRTELIAALEEARNHAAPLATTPGSQSPTLPAGHLNVRPEDASIERILASLEHQSDLKWLVGAHVCLGIGAIVVDRTDLARWLVARCLEHADGPAGAVRDLERFATQNTAKIRATLVLGGIAIRGAATTASGISLCSYDDLPPGFAREWAEHDLKKYQDMLRMMKRPVSSFVAITKVFDLSPVARPAGKPVVTPHALAAVFNELRTAAVCLGIVPGSTPTPISEWAHPEDPNAIPGYVGGQGAFWPIDRLPHFLATPPEPSKAAQLVSALERFSALPNKDQKQLLIPLERLAAARQEHRLEDRAIDIGIALESLFVDEKNNTEIQYRASLRAARFLARNPAQREEKRTLVKLLYGIRSSAVHSGVVEARTKDKSSKHVLLEGIALIEQALEKILRDGKRPNWDHVELGTTKK